MKNIILIAAIIAAITTIVAGVCPTPAKIQTPIPETEWEFGSIYDLSISDGCPILRNKEALLSEPLRDAIEVIRKDDNTSYGDFVIGYKYIPDEDVYIVNIIDEFVEL